MYIIYIHTYIFQQQNIIPVTEIKQEPNFDQVSQQQFNSMLSTSSLVQQQNSTKHPRCGDGGKQSFE